MQFNDDCLFTNYVYWCATFIALKYARDERGHQRLGLTRKQVWPRYSVCSKELLATKADPAKERLKIAPAYSCLDLQGTRVLDWKLARRPDDETASYKPICLGNAPSTCPKKNYAL